MKYEDSCVAAMFSLNHVQDLMHKLSMQPGKNTCIGEMKQDIHCVKSDNKKVEKFVISTDDGLSYQKTN